MSCTCLKDAMETVTGCVCPVAGKCERHNCNKTAHHHKLCRTRPDYFELWETGRFPCPESMPGMANQPAGRGLGDVVAAVIRFVTFGKLKPSPGCGCEKRKAWLNHFGARLAGWFRR